MSSTAPSLVKFLQGERPGMKAGQTLDLNQILFAPSLPERSILVQTIVQLADVSFWQGDIDFSKMKTEGLAAVIIRAGQKNWVDTRFKVNWDKAKVAALPRGSYWFYDSREKPEVQAKMWADLIVDDKGEVVHAADFEENYGGPYGKPEHFRIFIQTFQTITKLPDYRIVVYTGYYWWQRRIGNDNFFKKFKLWLAWYGAMEYVRIPLPWTSEAELAFWQYTSSGDGYLYGVSSAEIDLNYYCCSTMDFIRDYQISVGGPPNGEQPMTYLELSSTTSSSRVVRSGPRITYPQLSQYGYLYAGKIAKAGLTQDDVYMYIEDVPNPGDPSKPFAKAGDVWRRVFEVDGHAVSGWIAETHLGQTLLVVKQVGSTPPPPELGDVPVTITIGDDVTYEKQVITVLAKRKV